MELSILIVLFEAYQNTLTLNIQFNGFMLNRFMRKTNQKCHSSDIANSAHIRAAFDIGKKRCHFGNTQNFRTVAYGNHEKKLCLTMRLRADGLA